MYQDLSFMKIPLPEDVLKLKNYGDYAGAQKMIRYFLEHKEIPKALRKRLEIEQEIIGVMGADEYPYTYAEALEMMTSHLRDFKEEELQYLKEIGAADWIYIDGEVHFQRLFYDNLTQTRPDLAARVIVQNEELEKENAMKQKLLNGNVHYMKEHGGRTVHTRIRATIKAKKEFEEVGRKVSVHLPIPKVYEQVSNVQIHAANPEITFIAPEDAAQRTVYFETELQPNQEFMVEYSFDYHINYVELDPKRVAGEQPDFCLEEQSPHIMFTPYLRELRDELAGDETNPVILARRFYDFVTTKVMYSFVREYFTIECIPEYCAVNLKGDCGVQALLLSRFAECPVSRHAGSLGCMRQTTIQAVMIGRSSMLRLTDGYLQTSLLAEVHGAQAKLNAGIIISVIWMFFECLRTRKSRKLLYRRKNGFASTRLITSGANLNMRTMAFVFLRWKCHRNSSLWKILRNNN